MNHKLERIRAYYNKNKPDPSFNTAWACCMDDLGFVLAELDRRDKAIRWVLNDAAYKPPESISAEITERWLDRLKASMQPPSDTP